MHNENKDLEQERNILLNRNEDFKTRYEQLYINFNEVLENNRKLEERYKSENFITGYIYIIYV